MLSRTRAAAVVAAVATATLALPGAAFADDGASIGRQTMQLDCTGLGTITVLTPPSSAHDNWSAAQIVTGGHFVPVAFTYLVYDETAGLTLGDETVTHPAAHSRQSTTTCAASQTALLADLAPPDEPLPTGIAATDTVTLSFIATVIAKP
jgi:hypothetical protein